MESQIIQVADVLADPEYTYVEPALKAGYRTFLAAPMMREGQPIGVLVLARARVELFSDRQVELISTFADQAVIAIENARLFDEVQKRTDDLAESLQQQTATADVLKVISRSTFDLRTVLDTLTESAARLCTADKGVIFLRDGEVYRMAANFGFSREAEAYALQHPLPPGEAARRGGRVGGADDPYPGCSCRSGVRRKRLFSRCSATERTSAFRCCATARRSVFSC